MALKVNAIAAGLYGHYRVPGEHFELKDEKHFHDSWMEKVDAKKKSGKEKSESAPESEVEASPEESVI